MTATACEQCGIFLDPVLAQAGETTHPCCDPGAGEHQPACDPGEPLGEWSACAGCGCRYRPADITARCYDCRRLLAPADLPREAA